MTVPGQGPDYVLHLVATATGQVVDTLPWTDWSFGDALPWASPGTLTATVPLLGRDLLGPLTLSSVRSIRQAGQGYALAVSRNGRALWAGPCTAMNWTSTDATIGCTSLGKLFDGRALIAAGYLGNPLGAPPIHLELGLADRVIELLTQGSTGDGRTLPLVLPAEAGGGGPAVDYAGADIGTVYDRVNETVQLDGGPDVFVTPVLSTDQSTLQWVVNVGRPLLGYGAPVATFDLNVEVDGLSGADDYTQMTTTQYVPGDTTGTAGARLVGVATQPPIGARLAFERTDRTSVSSASQVMLDGLAASSVKVNADPLQTWTVTIFPDDHPLYLDEWGMGDVVKLAVFGHPLVEDGEYVRRVVGVSSHTPTSLGLVTTDVPSGMVVG
jgi:hypothetical protein